MINNIQVFPVQSYEYDGQNNVLQFQSDGMTLLDYFAGQALIGLAGTPNNFIAKEAYKIAVLMMQEREKIIEEIKK